MSGLNDAQPDDQSAKGSHDLLYLTDVLNGVIDPAPPAYQTDTDRSDATNANDMLRVIDLLNGAGTYDEYVDAELPGAPGPIGGVAVAPFLRGDVDLDDDFALWIGCLTGPGAGIDCASAFGCQIADLDRDGDLDLRDVAKLMNASGDGIEP